MTKYFVEMELRTFYLVEVNADTENDAANIAMRKPELWMESKPIDQAYGVHTVLKDEGDDDENNS